MVPPAAAKKKSKNSASRRDSKSQEEELRKVRQEMVQKLKFQNSFDSGPKPRQPKAKDHDKAQAKPQPSHVRVGQYRSSKAAQAKIAELHKQGIKATLKKTKDSKGVLYIVYKPGAAPANPEPQTHKPKKSGGAAPGL